MDLYEIMMAEKYQILLNCADLETGLRGYIAVHSTQLGPALGGCRMFPYVQEADAIHDVLRLARAMTHKAACAGLELGGGKAVIIGDPSRDKTPALLQSFGRFVERLQGKYITAEDVGTTVADMAEVAKVTRWVTGLTGDPSPHTSDGCLAGIRACLEHQHGDGRLKGVRVALQGLGKVGATLAGLLHREGAVLTVTDVDADRCRRAEAELGARVVAPEAIWDQPADVYAPCAMGGAVTAAVAGRLPAGAIIAGAANNQLAEPGVARLLRERGILYAPDYVINAGGLIYCYYEMKRQDDEGEIRRHVASIAGNLAAVFRKAEADRCTTAEAAERLAEERIQSTRPV